MKHIKRLLKSISRNRWMFCSIVPSIYLNFKVLPFKQAMKIPILVYKPKFRSLKGRIRIDAPLKFGMIRIGYPIVSIYPNNGVMLELKEEVNFKGTAHIGNDTYISVGEKGLLEIGNEFGSTCGLKLVCYHKIRMENNVLIGWNCMICDTDFHKLTWADGKNRINYGPITIGEGSWLANSCKIYKNVDLPPYTVVASDTILTCSPKSNEKSLICNDRRNIVKASGVFLNRQDDQIVYSDNADTIKACKK